jgi:gas vesicle structural protein
MTTSELVPAGSSITLVELVDRLLDKGVVVSGEVTIAVADIDLIELDLRVLLSSVETMEKQR